MKAAWRTCGDLRSHGVSRPRVLFISAGPQAYGDVSPYTVPGTRSRSYFNHLSLLGAAEDLLGLPRLPTAAGFTRLQSAFGL